MDKLWRDVPGSCPTCGDRLIENKHGIECSALYCNWTASTGFTLSDPKNPQDSPDTSTQSTRSEDMSKKQEKFDTSPRTEGQRLAYIWGGMFTPLRESQLAEHIDFAHAAAYERGKSEVIESACSLVEIYVGEKESMPATSEHVCSKIRALKGTKP